jgi:hypothetical protein
VDRRPGWRRPGHADLNAQRFFFDRWHRADPYDDQSPWIAGRYPPMRRGQSSHYSFGGIAGDSDAFETNVWYLRLKRIELGYRLPTSLMDNLNMSSGRLILALDNFLTWDNLEHLNTDPEIIQESALRYPTSKILTLGFSATVGGSR